MHKTRPYHKQVKRPDYYMQTHALCSRRSKRQVLQSTQAALSAPPMPPRYFNSKFTQGIKHQLKQQKFLKTVTNLVASHTHAHMLARTCTHPQIHQRIYLFFNQAKKTPSKTGRYSPEPVTIDKGSRVVDFEPVLVGLAHLGQHVQPEWHHRCAHGMRTTWSVT